MSNAEKSGKLKEGLIRLFAYIAGICTIIGISIFYEYKLDAVRRDLSKQRISAMKRHAEVLELYKEKYKLEGKLSRAERSGKIELEQLRREAKTNDKVLNIMNNNYSVLKERYSTLKDIVGFIVENGINDPDVKNHEEYVKRRLKEISVNNNLNLKTHPTCREVIEALVAR